MAGYVYTYNIFGEAAGLLMNGAAASIQIAGNMGPSGKYLPSFAKVDSASHSDESSGRYYRGGDGENALRITWDTGYSECNDFMMPTSVDDVSLDDDLIVYISKDFATVQTKEGIVKKVNRLIFHEVK